MKNLILIITLLAITFSQAQSQSKKVALIHGHNGNGNSWEGLTEKFNENCSNLEAATYDNQLASTSGLAEYTLAVKDSLAGSDTDNNDIAICHSFGGGAIRKLDAKGSNLFGGFITVASPHQGAYLANSVLNKGQTQEGKRNPSLDLYLESGCKTVVEDIIHALNDVQSFNLDGFLALYGLTLTDAFCECSLDYVFAHQAVAEFMGNMELLFRVVLGKYLSLWDVMV